MTGVDPAFQGEARTIDSALLPLTVDSLAEELAACGLASGQTILVHTRMSALGWIAGGPVAVIQALRRVLGPRGTLMMPAHTMDNIDPANWSNPPAPEAWWPLIRAHMPAYDPAVTPTRGMGRVAELFRTLPGVVRGAHPLASFAACGPLAEFLTADHTSLETPFGEASPLARLYDADGFVCLLGVSHENDTSLHLAEMRAAISRRIVHEGCAMLVDGERRWISYEMVTLDTDDFAALGDAYEREHAIPRGKVGQAEVRFMKQRPLIDYAVRWLEAHRKTAN